jgi:hypothetical protein
MILICGCFGNNTSQLMDSYNKAGARDVAEKFIKSTEEYGFNGRVLSCTNAKMLTGDNNWEFRCTYRTAISAIELGGGHEVMVRVESNVVKTALLDGNKTLL